MCEGVWSTSQLYHPITKEDKKHRIHPTVRSIIPSIIEFIKSSKWNPMNFLDINIIFAAYKSVDNVFRTSCLIYRVPERLDYLSSYHDDDNFSHDCLWFRGVFRMFWRHFSVAWYLKRRHIAGVPSKVSKFYGKIRSSELYFFLRYSEYTTRTAYISHITHSCETLVIFHWQLVVSLHY